MEIFQTSIPLPIAIVNLIIPITECGGTDQENVSSRLSRGLIVSIGCTLEFGLTLERPTPMWLIKALKARRRRTMQSVHEEMAILIEAIIMTLA